MVINELLYHPSETNLRLADVVIINKVDTASPGDVEIVKNIVEELNPDAKVVIHVEPCDNTCAKDCMENCGKIE